MNTIALPIQPTLRRSLMATILGHGLAVPPYAIDQLDAALIAQRLELSQRWHNALPALYRRSGVARRGSVLLDNEAIDLDKRQAFFRPATLAQPFGPTTAERMSAYARHAGPLLQTACRQALLGSNVESRQVTHLITVSCTGFHAPGVDFELIEGLDLSPSIQRTHVGFMGCHAALNALRVAKSIVEADREACVLVGAVELCSLHQQYTDDAQQLVANALFADGASGLVIGTIDSLDDADVEAEGSGWQIIATGSTILAETTDMMGWTIGDHGFLMRLVPQVPNLIEQHLQAWLASWLKQQSSDIDEIEAWAIHPGGPRIVQAVGQALGLASEQLAPSLSILQRHGNMSSPTIIFILDQISKSQTFAKRCLMIAFGPGLCIEVALLQRSPMRD